MRSETGALWCRGLCRDVSLTELVHRVHAVRDNAMRLEVSTLLVTRPAPLRAVPGDENAPAARAAQLRGAVVDSMVRSLYRLRTSASAMARSADRLEATRKALSLCKGGAVSVDPPSAGRSLSLCRPNRV
ncbi:hypothetical protein FE88_15310 [Azospirillum brasilense]|nr:hypothetical protein [Azospirillum brasilense]PWC86032.1 hypothetical protein AEJ54_27625 [Azospirillum sp. Sp 7]ALJ36842.1 hypothetical protein AMK58_15070 [Azospirillum brasilense]MDW7630936.1 hypothetical protein [Azospirillum brasilense]OPH14398.1 hypothetical protein FE89_16710 [Azospirillum brasilense]OPH19971.1 hypothetical protein FE88_15310 [Azospirillum brasilense]